MHTLNRLTQSSKTEKIAIFGFYKTGTTALFYRVKNALSVAPRTLFEASSYQVEPQDEQTGVLAKVILKRDKSEGAVDYSTFETFEKKLLITRDPRDWLISGTLFLIQQNPSIYENEGLLNEILRLLEIKTQNPHAVSLLSILSLVLSPLPVGSPEKLLAEISELHEWSFQFNSKLEDFVYARYEDFVDGRVGMLSDYLGFSIHKEPVLETQHLHVVRTCSSGDWKNWFNAEDVSFFKKSFAPYLEKYAYPTDWLISETPRIKSEHADLYVRRTVAIRKSNSRELR